MAQFNTTELDFDQIKSNLKAHFLRAEGPFNDWDFEGSGLSALLDVLAYNTHYNAINAHMAMNESFLDSAQLRSNVISRAKLLGYTPKSIVAPKAFISLKLVRASGSLAGTYTLNSGTKFTTDVNGISYTYQTTSDITAQFDANLVIGSETGGFDFSGENGVGIPITEGKKKKVSYTSDTSFIQKFLIKDVNADTSTLKVNVFDDLNATVGTAYSIFGSFVGVDENSTVYFLNENMDGLFDVTFGDGVLGKTLTTLNKVELDYLVTSGPESNGANAFTYAGGSNTIVSGTNVLSVVTKSAGGAIQETIESIKHNAPLRFISQDRAVTAEDYKAILKENFNTVGSVTVWGGEENPISDFGKVYIAIKPADTSVDALTVSQKSEIINFLTNKKVISIAPKIVDPDFLYLYHDVFFKYDSSKTSLTQDGLIISAKNTIANFELANLNNFDGVYRHSNFLSTLDNSLTAILNSAARVYMYKKLVITVVNTATSNGAIEFGQALDGEIDQTESMISSTQWNYNGKAVELGDEKIAGDTEKRNIFVFSRGADGKNERVLASAGHVFPLTGLVALTNLPATVTATVEVSARPASDDVVSKFNEVIKFDSSKTKITADLDTSIVGSQSSLNTYKTFNRDN